jgi:hypothetical protein
LCIRTEPTEAHTGESSQARPRSGQDPLSTMFSCPEPGPLDPYDVQEAEEQSPIVVKGWPPPQILVTVTLALWVLQGYRACP